MYKVLLVGSGGFIGASVRYLISVGSTKWFKTDFPLATMMCNVLGAVLIGFVMHLGLKSIISPDYKIFLTTGLLGGLTTFSTFSFETVSLFQSGRYFFCIINIILNLTLCLAGVWLGTLFGKYVV